MRKDTEMQEHVNEVMSEVKGFIWEHPLECALGACGAAVVGIAAPKAVKRVKKMVHRKKRHHSRKPNDHVDTIYVEAEII